MILQWFAEMIYKIMTGLLGWINLPQMSDDFRKIFDYIDLIVSNGTSIANFFIPHNIFTVGFPILIAIIGFKYGYYLVMWILKKIPMASIN